MRTRVKQFLSSIFVPVLGGLRDTPHRLEAMTWNRAFSH